MTDQGEPAHPVLVRAIQVVGVLFAAFGGFLAKIAPPDETHPAIAVGLASFLTLGVMLFVSALAKHARRRHKALWLSTGVVALAFGGGLGLAYHGSLLLRTFPYSEPTSDSSYIAGTELAPEGQLYVTNHPSEGTTEMVRNFGGVNQRARIWTEPSMAQSRRVLTAMYVALVVCFAIAIFSLSEGALGNPVREGAVREAPPLRGPGLS